jgi:hypothetical protein
MITKEEFKTKFEEFWRWVGSPKSAETSYWLSVEDFANMMYVKAKKAEDEATRKFVEDYKAKHGAS